MALTERPPRGSTRGDRLRLLLRRVPGQVWGLVIGGAVIVGGFAAVVLPLITTGGHDVRAELAGRVDEHGTAGRAVEVPIAVDNTGTAVINPLCIEVSFAAPADAVEVRFQGLDVIPFRGGRACGGQLSGQETVSVVVVVRPRAAGTLPVTVAPAQGSRRIGPPLQGMITVGP